MEEKMGRRERKKMLSRQAILAAAVREFSQKGFKETSVADIMNAADLVIGTSYNYFQSKEEILMHLLGGMVQEVDDSLKELKEARRPACEQLASACSITAKFLDENRYVLPLFLAAAEHSGLPEKAEERKPMPTPGFKHLFESILQEAQQAGEVRNHVPPELIA
jgi:AcrR family transcriptional regulator